MLFVGWRTCYGISHNFTFSNLCKEITFLLYDCLTSSYRWMEIKKSFLSQYCSKTISLGIYIWHENFLILRFWPRAYSHPTGARIQFEVCDQTTLVHYVKYKIIKLNYIEKKSIFPFLYCRLLWMSFVGINK